MNEIVIHASYLRDILFSLSMTEKAKITKEVFWHELYFAMSSVNADEEKVAFLISLEIETLGFFASDLVNKPLMFDQIKAFILSHLDIEE